MCGCKKYPYPHPPPTPTEGIEISWRVGGFYKTKKLKKCMKLNWNFQRGREVFKKIFRGGSMDIFWIHTITFRSWCD